MNKLYQYTILRQDGTKDVLEPCPKKTFKGVGGLYELLNCESIEMIPSSYWVGLGYGKVRMWGDEEGRFKPHTRNPHFKVMHDDLGNPWDVVGDVVMERLYKEKNSYVSDFEGFSG